LTTTIIAPDTGPNVNVPISAGTSEKLNSKKLGKANDRGKLKIYSTPARQENIAIKAMRVGVKYILLA
jgi:hypothetical protein